ncbi:hypothetical protein [Bacillus cereus]|uniref:hypothetical protein n=1 Tax=Bacillus cereus TaxID=1396 RepID=UPI0015966887
MYSKQKLHESMDYHGKRILISYYRDGMVHDMYITVLKIEPTTQKYTVRSLSG